MSLQHVYFRYNNNDAYALNDINCTFLQGKKYAIMGPSGSGKSTLAKVISGMYRNYEGNILYDGKTIFYKGIMPSEVGFRFSSGL